MQNGDESIHVKEIVVRDHFAMSLIIPLHLQGNPTYGVVDTAAQVTVVSSRLVESMGVKYSHGEKVVLKGIAKTLLSGTKIANFPIKIQEQMYLHDVYITDIDDPILIGLDFLTTYFCQIDLKTNSVTINGIVVKATLRRLEHGEEVLINRVVVKERTFVPACSKVNVQLQTQDGFRVDDLVVFEPTLNEEYLLFSSSLHQGNSQIITSLLNLLGKGVTLPKGKEVGVLTTIDSIIPEVPNTCQHIRSVQMQRPDQFEISDFSVKERSESDDENREVIQDFLTPFVERTKIVNDDGSSGGHVEKILVLSQQNVVKDVNTVDVVKDFAKQDLDVETTITKGEDSREVKTSFLDHDPGVGNVQDDTGKGEICRDHLEPTESYSLQDGNNAGKDREKIKSNTVTSKIDDQTKRSLATLSEVNVEGLKGEAIEDILEDHTKLHGMSSCNGDIGGKIDLAQHIGIPIHLRELFSRSRVELNESESYSLGQLLKEYQDIFAVHDLDLGCFRGIEHHINTGDATPVKHKLRKTPYGFEKEEEAYLNKLLEAKVIQPSNSEWASAPVFVRKRDGSVRYCLDFRDLNSKTVKDSFPLPNIDDCLATLSGSWYFSTLDLTSGFYQIKLNEEDRKKTAFVTKYGLFEHTRMPMGLCNSPATFQRAMQLVLRGLTWKEVLAYLDDVNVLGKTFEDHLYNLKQVFDRFRYYNLKLKPKKCNLFQSSCEFLGKYISREGVSISPGKLDCIEQWPVPQNKKELQAFLGYANYHREHIRGYAGIVSSLYNLTGSNTSFEWEQEHDDAFNNLKCALTSAPCLAYPTTTGLFILDTDASDKSIGAELSQIQEGSERVISYASNSLIAEQKRYCTTRKELLAVVKFCRHFRHYLLGRKFLLRTDHHSLVWLMRFRRPEGQLARWLEELSQYDMDIIHRAGAKHSNADGLSRIPENENCDCFHAGAHLEDLPCKGCNYCTRKHQQWERFINDVDDVVPLAHNAHMIRTSPMYSSVPHLMQVQSLKVDSNDLDPPTINWSENLSMSEIKDQQKEDKDLHCILEWLQGDIPTESELRLSSPATKHLWQCKRQLSLEDGVLFYTWDHQPNRRKCLVVPEKLKSKILHYCHDIKSAGHLGRDKTLSRLKQSFMWFNMARDCEAYVRSCSTCNKNKKSSRQRRASLKAFHAGSPVERVHLDILGPFTPSNQGNVYILSIIDQFTKWIECVALPSQKAELVAKAFLHHFIVIFGCPLEVHTDQGSNFTSDLFLSLCELLEISKTRTTPYHPSSNGQVERYNRTIVQIIRCYIDGKIGNWDQDLPLLNMVLRASESQTTGFTPNMLMFGRENNLPIDILAGTASINSNQKEPGQWLQHLVETLSDVHHFARQHIGRTQKRQKRIYDQRSFESIYSMGDLVYVVDDSTKIGQSKKLRSPWKGPFIIIEARHPLYTVRDRKRDTVRHHDKLKRCEDRNIPLWLRRARSCLFEQGYSSVDSDADNSADYEQNCYVDRDESHSTDSWVTPDTTIVSDTSEDAEAENGHISEAIDSHTDSSDDESTNSVLIKSKTSSGRTVKRPSYLQDYVE